MHTQLTLFYDGYCPLCLAEMSKLGEYDKQGVLAFVDINGAEFALQFPLLNWQELNDRIHGQLADGRLISGLDVTYLAWKLVGKGWVYAPLRWPIITWFADRAYLFFARYRYQISYLLTGKKRVVTTQNCATCVNTRKSL